MTTLAPPQAGSKGIEPLSWVLETRMLPLHQPPKKLEWRDSNPQPRDPKSRMLPIATHPNKNGHGGT